MDIQGSTISERIISYVFGKTKKCKYCGEEYRTLSTQDDNCCFKCMYFDVNILWKEAERMVTKVDLFDWRREIGKSNREYDHRGAYR
jgi:hypothetical protein